MNENDRLPKIRTKRGVWPPAALNLEIAIFVDQDLYRLMAVNFESNTEKEIIRFVLAMVNAVSCSLYTSICTCSLFLLIAINILIFGVEKGGTRCYKM